MKSGVSTKVKVSLPNETPPPMNVCCFSIDLTNLPIKTDILHDGLLIDERPEPFLFVNFDAWVSVCCHDAVFSRRANVSEAPTIQSKMLNPTPSLPERTVLRTAAEVSGEDCNRAVSIQHVSAAHRHTLPGQTAQQIHCDRRSCMATVRSNDLQE